MVCGSVAGDELNVSMRTREKLEIVRKGEGTQEEVVLPKARSVVMGTCGKRRTGSVSIAPFQNRRKWKRSPLPWLVPRTALIFRHDGKSKHINEQSHTSDGNQHKFPFTHSHLMDNLSNADATVVDFPHSQGSQGGSYETNTYPSKKAEGKAPATSHTVPVGILHNRDVIDYVDQKKPFFVKIEEGGLMTALTKLDQELIAV